MEQDRPWAFDQNMSTYTHKKKKYKQMENNRTKTKKMFFVCSKQKKNAVILKNNNLLLPCVSMSSHPPINFASNATKNMKTGSVALSLMNSELKKVLIKKKFKWTKRRELLLFFISFWLYRNYLFDPLSLLYQNKNGKLHREVQVNRITRQFMFLSASITVLVNGAKNTCIRKHW